MRRFDMIFPRFMYLLYAAFGVAHLLYGHWPATIFYAAMILVLWWICNRWRL